MNLLFVIFSLTMVKHCAYMTCNSDDRYTPELKFVPFVKPWKDLNRAEQWKKLIGRPDLKISKDTYLCAKHFPENESELNPRHNLNLEPFEVETDPWEITNIAALIQFS